MRCREEENGRWRLSPTGGPKRVQRNYRPGTLILETEMEADGGSVRVIDLMPVRGRDGGNNADVVRIVEGIAVVWRCRWI